MFTFVILTNVGDVKRVDLPEQHARELAGGDTTESFGLARHASKHRGHSGFKASHDFRCEAKARKIVALPFVLTLLGWVPRRFGAGSGENVLPTY